jgi:hypothetical protein
MTWFQQRFLLFHCWILFLIQLLIVDETAAPSKKKKEKIKSLLHSQEQKQTAFINKKIKTKKLKIKN